MVFAGTAQAFPLDISMTSSSSCAPLNSMERGAEASHLKADTVGPLRVRWAPWTPVRVPGSQVPPPLHSC